MSELKHSQIVEQLTKYVDINLWPYGVWIAGGAASGKGYVMRMLLQAAGIPAEQYAYLDVDAHRYSLAAWIEDDHRPKLLTTVARTQPEAGHINDRAMTECARRRKNFVIDGTMRNAKQAQDAQKRMKDLSGSWKETGAKQ